MATYREARFIRAWENVSSEIANSWHTIAAHARLQSICPGCFYLLGKMERGMRTALYLLGFQGLIGAFDTLFYHEWKARLPARGRRAAPELLLHAARDFFYGGMFCTLPWLAWKGTWTIVLLGVIGAEIILTLWDFVVEIAVR